MLVMFSSVCESVKRDDPDDYSDCKMSAVEQNTLIGWLLTLTSAFNANELICPVKGPVKAPFYLFYL